MLSFVIDADVVWFLIELLLSSPSKTKSSVKGSNCPMRSLIYSSTATLMIRNCSSEISTQYFIFLSLIAIMIANAE